MSNYTDKMTAELVSAGSFTFDQAASFADKYQLSTRSVVSKIKSLDLDYTPKAKPASKAGARTTKADLVQAIALGLSCSFESIEGLSKADSRSLSALLMEIN
jgi:hypothetical protein